MENGMKKYFEHQTTIELFAMLYNLTRNDKSNEFAAEAEMIKEIIKSRA